MFISIILKVALCEFMILIRYPSAEGKVSLEANPVILQTVKAKLWQIV